MKILRCRHLEPLLTGFKYTTTALTAALDTGSMDFNEPTREDAGNISTTVKETGIFNRGRVNVVTPAEDVADGGYGGFYDATAIEPAIFAIGGAGDDGSAYCLLAGFGNSDTDRFDDAQAVRSTLNGPVLVGFYVTNDGAAALNGAGKTLGSVTRDSEGIVTLTFTPGHPSLRTLAVSCVDAACRSPLVTASSHNSITVKVTDEAGVVQDSDFIVLVLFSKNVDDAGQCRDIIETPQAFPELIIGRCSISGGAPVIQVGGATHGVDFTVTDDGDGLYTITSTKTFGLNILPVVCAATFRAQLMATPDTNSFQVGVFTDAGVAADDGFVFIALCGDGTSAEQY